MIRKAIVVCTVVLMGANAAGACPPEEHNITPPVVEITWAGKLPPSEILEEIIRWFPNDEVNTAICVMWYESRYNSNTAGDSGASIGLYQIKWDNLAGRYVLNGLQDEFGPAAGNRIRKQQAISILKDISENIRLAAKIWEADEWLPNWLAQKYRCNLEN